MIIAALLAEITLPFSITSEPWMVVLPQFTVKLEPILAAILGYHPNHYHDISVTDDNQHYSLREVNGHFSPDPHADVDYLHLYCDIIQPTRFGGQMVDILAFLPHCGNNNNYSVQRPTYKKKSTNTNDPISVFVSATIVLHIRPTPSKF